MNRAKRREQPSRRKVAQALHEQTLKNMSKMQLMETAMRILLDDDDWDNSDLIKWILDNQKA